MRQVERTVSCEEQTHSKTLHMIIACKLDQNDLPDPYFCPSSRQFVESVKKDGQKKLSQIPTAPEFRLSIFGVKTTSR